ncbi:hypothetical protein, partial [uncultured Gemmiger sp.]|uniref:hypothetical protein n=1 Tax=uncultured Gemmiger sp. TaxID=1623490 RepID=UPI0025FEF971
GRLSSRQPIYFISFRSLCQDLFEIFLNSLSAALPIRAAHALSLTALRGRPESVQLYYHEIPTASSVFGQNFAKSITFVIPYSFFPWISTI